MSLSRPSSPTGVPSGDFSEITIIPNKVPEHMTGILVAKDNEKTPLIKKQSNSFGFFSSDNTKPSWFSGFSINYFKLNWLNLFSSDNLKLVVKAALAFIGLGAGALYEGPAGFCTLDAECSRLVKRFVTDVLGFQEPLSSKTVYYIYFAMGAFYSFINGWMSLKSLDAFMDYLAKQDKLAAKIVKAMAIAIFALAQVIPTASISMKTSKTAWGPILTTTGAVPSAFYGAVGIADKQLPLLLSLIAGYHQSLKYKISDFWSPLTEIERLQRQRYYHYRKEHQKFLGDIDMKMRYISRNARRLDSPTASTNPQHYLMSHERDVRSAGAALLHNFGSIVGALWAIEFSASALKNTYEGLGENLSYLPNALHWMLAAFCNSSLLYGNIKFMSNGVSMILDSVLDVMNGRSIDSLIWQLRVKMTAAALVTLSILASPSYPVIAVLFNEEFPGNDTVHEVGRIAAMAGIDFYHLRGLVHFYHLAVSSLTKDEKAKFLFEVEREAEKLQKLTFEEFVNLVEKNTLEENLALGVAKFEEPEVKPSDISIVRIVPKQKATESWCSWFTSFLPGSQKEKEQVVLRKGYSPV